MALPFYIPDLHRGVAAYAREHNWNLCSEPALYTGMLPDQWEGDGIITNMRNAKYKAYVEKCGVKAVSIGVGPQVNVPTISIDHREICRIGAEYLLAKGFKRFAWYTNKPIKIPVRLPLFREFLKPHGYDCQWLNFPILSNWKSQRLNLARAIKQMKYPLAIFCSDDNAAAELVTVCQDYNIKVPEEVAILGVNNDELVCESISMPLSSVNVDYQRYGYLAAALLDRCIDGKTTTGHQYFFKADRVVERLSTDAIAVDHPKIAKALRYMKENFRDQISVKDVIKQTRMTDAGFARAFEKHVGKTPGEFLCNLKLNEVERLLKETDMPIAEVATKSGFGDYHGLYTAMKREGKQTPSKIRKEKYRQ